MLSKSWVHKSANHQWLWSGFSPKNHYETKNGSFIVAERIVLIVMFERLKDLILEIEMLIIGNDLSV